MFDCFNNNVNTFSKTIDSFDLFKKQLLKQQQQQQEDQQNCNFGTSIPTLSSAMIEIYNNNYNILNYSNKLSTKFPTNIQVINKI